MPPRLDVDHLDAYNSAMSSSSPVPNLLGLTFEMMECLKDGKQLKCQVINAYLELLQLRDRRWRTEGQLTQHPKCHFFSTFFYNKLFTVAKEYNYRNVAKWCTAKKLQRLGQPSRDVFECDLIIIPVHLPGHWVLAIINVACLTVEFFDSCLQDNTEVTQNLTRFIEDEWKARRTDQPVRSTCLPWACPSMAPKLCCRQGLLERQKVQLRLALSATMATTHQMGRNG